MRQRAIALLTIGVLLLSACGGDGEETDDPGSPTEGQDLASKPTFTVPSDEAPPDELQVRTLVEGEGPVIRTGQTAVMHYVGKAWSTGEEFDASWDRRQPFSFTLGEGRVIRGWETGVGGSRDLGIAAMRVGERRQLVIPPQLGYGEAGAGGVIGPNETLVFVVDLVAVEED